LLFILKNIHMKKLAILLAVVSLTILGSCSKSATPTPEASGTESGATQNVAVNPEQQPETPVPTPEQPGT
jgi:hypothetical protein